MGAKYTDAQKEATAKYQKTLASLSIRIKKEEYEKYKEAAAAAKMSLREFIISALNDKISRDGLQTSSR